MSAELDPVGEMMREASAAMMSHRVWKRGGRRLGSEEEEEGGAPPSPNAERRTNCGSESEKEKNRVPASKPLAAMLTRRQVRPEDVRRTTFASFAEKSEEHPDSTGLLSMLQAVRERGTVRPGEFAHILHMQLRQMVDAMLAEDNA